VRQRRAASEEESDTAADFSRWPPVPPPRHRYRHHAITFYDAAPRFDISSFRRYSPSPMPARLMLMILIFARVRARACACAARYRHRDQEGASYGEEATRRRPQRPSPPYAIAPLRYATARRRLHSAADVVAARVFAAAASNVRRRRPAFASSTPYRRQPTLIYYSRITPP